MQPIGKAAASCFGGLVQSPDHITKILNMVPDVLLFATQHKES